MAAFVEMKDRVLIRGRQAEGEFVVTQITGMVGRISSDDLPTLNPPGKGDGVQIVKRGELVLVRKATKDELAHFGW